MSFGERDKEIASVSVPIFRKKNQNSWSIDNNGSYF